MNLMKKSHRRERCVWVYYCDLLDQRAFKALFDWSGLGQQVTVNNTDPVNLSHQSQLCLSVCDFLSDAVTSLSVSFSHHLFISLVTVISSITVGNHHYYCCSFLVLEIWTNLLNFDFVTLADHQIRGCVSSCFLRVSLTISSSYYYSFLGTISRCSPISTHRPDTSNRPLSRAAQEIMEVQTVQQLDLQDSDEDEEDCLALACLEEEFRNMSTTQWDEGEDGHIPVD